MEYIDNFVAYVGLLFLIGLVWMVIQNEYALAIRRARKRPLLRGESRRRIKLI